MAELNSPYHVVIEGEKSKVVNNNLRIIRIMSMVLDHFIMCILIVLPIGFDFWINRVSKGSLSNGILVISFYYIFHLFE